MPVSILFYIFFICFSHNVFSISEDSKTKKIVSNVKGEQYNYKRIQKINTRLKNQEKQIKKLNSGLDNQKDQIEEQKDQIEEQKDQIEEQKDQIEEQKTHFNNYKSEQKIKNYRALFTILFGLLFEILGALLLSASVLSTKIKKRINFDTRFTPGLDMSLIDKEKNQILINYSMIGSIILYLGFLVQFIGTAFLLDLSWIPIICIICFGVLFGLFVLRRLLSIDPAQTRNQKIIILYNNTVRLLNFMLNFRLLLRKHCDICLKPVKKDNVFILWYDEGNSETSPYSHPPENFLVGHKKCLDSELKFQLKTGKNFQKEAIKKYSHFKNGEEFIKNYFEQYKKWFKDCNSYWSKKDFNYSSSKEIEFYKAVEKIKKINK